MYNTKKYFKIQAKLSLYSHIYVEAKDAEQARELADNIDGGDFKPDLDTYGEQDGAWDIWAVEECTETPPADEISDVKPEPEDEEERDDWDEQINKS